MSKVNIEVARAARAELAEGPVWDDRNRVLWWVNILAGELHRLDPSDGSDTSWTVDDTIGSFALRESGGFLLGLRDGIYSFSTESAALEALARPEPERTSNRFNDGKTDRRGRFWIGSLHDREVEATGALYRVDGDGSCHRMVDGIYASNGIAFSPDGRVGYHADSQRRIVWRFDCDPDSGTLTNRTVFIELEPGTGVPDGATLDVDGCYWLTHAHGWRLVRYDPAGRADRIIELPVEVPTCPAFGGDDCRTLFLTTATYGLNPEQIESQPLAGSILALDVGVGGVPDTRFPG
jgi:sugar lactone lactonase YvrE